MYLQPVFDLMERRSFQKTKQDYVSGAMFHPQDLSNIIYLNGIPDHVFMRRLMVDPKVHNSPFYWSEMEFSSASGTGAYYYDGDRPSTISTVPSRLNNNLFQVGLCAEVTDKEAAMYAKGGGFQLHSGNNLSWFKEEMKLQMKGRILEVMGEMSYIFINGDGSTTVTASLGREDVQCDGMFNLITNNTVSGSGYISDSQLITLAKAIRDQKTGRSPQVLYVNSNQKKTINTWATNIWFGRDRNLEAGRDVSTFNTGFGIVSVDIDDHIPVGSCAMIDHSMWWQMVLIPLTAEGLARDRTSVVRMVTFVGSLKCGNDRSSGKITGLTE